MLAASLYDDGVQYLSTLEMNRAASFTYGYRVSGSSINSNNVNLLGDATTATVVTHGESVADEMWQILIDLTLLKFTQHSVLVLTKTIHLIQHVLLYGSEACIMNGELLYRIEMAVEPLRNLNTALIEQQMVEGILNSEGRARGGENDILSSEGIGQQLSQLGTRASATLLKLRGGSVDKGHPVRMAASKLHGIVSNPNNLRQMRMQQQQQSPAESLVPIGSAKQVGYITDEGRYKVLQAKMAAEERQLKQSQLKEQQRFQQTRSNLAGSSATDSFGGGYSSNSSTAHGGGKLVVGAAHSLQDMIDSAKYELEQHKVKQQQKIASLRKGYSDDPMARAQQLAELERSTSIESDPEYIRKKKALEDALEYLEEMQRLEEEKVGVVDLLGDDALRNDGRAQISSSNGGAMMSSSGDGEADLLGFDSNPILSQVDVFGAISTSFSADNSTVNVGGGADLLGFDTIPVRTAVDNTAPYLSSQFIPNNSKAIPNTSVNSNSFHGGGIFGNNATVGMRPSLVTGALGGVAGVQAPYTTPTPLVPITSSLAPQLDEDAEAEKSRKLHMAAGLFAGVVPTTQEDHQRKPIMQSDQNSSGCDSDPFGMGPMGGSCGIPIAGIAPPTPPSMAPPPPPMQPPPPPPMQPPPAPYAMAPNNDANNAFNNNLTVEQMQEMIKQQQAQMNQMMQMMQLMQMQGSNNSSNI